MGMADVAKAAGVSIASVSRVLNGKPGVSQELIEQILRAADQVGYVPRKGRRGIRVGSVAVLVPDVDSRALRTALMARLLHGVEPYLREHEVRTVVTGLSAPDRPPDFVNPHDVDGVIIRTAYPYEQLDLRLGTLPHVWVFELAGTPQWGDLVIPDNQAVGRLAAQSLCSRGRRRLCYVASGPNAPATIERGQAFAHHARQRGATVSRLIEDWPDSVPTERLLAGEDVPDGIFVFVGGETAAVAALHHALADRGLRPGRDVELVACANEVGSLGALRPAPAWIDIQPEAIGRAAVDMLLWRMKSPGEPQRTMTVAPRLVESHGGGYD